MIRAFPYVPLGGQIRIGIAIFSYDGEVNFGITGDYDTTPDIDVLAGGSRTAWPRCSSCLPEPCPGVRSSRRP
jgi:hypothetical protein